ncbi:hypothetical protein A4D02_07080 [Niastella koreensis]|uniref:Band 7 domain-containing protein n=1 Tax=Niastella koreensis TaxID=354356 RepID=A0ABX3NXT7_9BACT|nr:SPFH domain-containing protein [Niastella koreensis]OQP48468.1 hypothetical protein A4D02_07080 [Niastella koreensis]
MYKGKIMLLSITTWWQHLEAFEKILWGIAFTFSSLYLLQNLLSLSGGDTGHGDGHAMSMFRRYKRCPSDRVLVVYGKVGRSKDGTNGNLSAKCIHGGAAFIWPVIQDYKFLDLTTPISIEVNLTNALSKQNIRVDVPSRFTVGISTEQGVMQNAAECLLVLLQPQIHDLAKDIILNPEGTRRTDCRNPTRPQLHDSCCRKR